MTYRTCKDCGANLDPCESCDCADEENAASLREQEEPRAEIMMP